MVISAEGNRVSDKMTYIIEGKNIVITLPE